MMNIFARRLDAIPSTDGEKEGVSEEHMTERPENNSSGESR